jgi:sugar phosphate isomerase/epimerase
MRTLTFGFLNFNSLPSGTASPQDTLAAATEAGFNSVGLRITGRRPEDPFPELADSRERIAVLRQLATDRGARISSVTGYGHFPDVGLEHHERVMNTAAELGCTLMLLNVYDENHLAFTDALAKLGERAASYGIRIAVELMPFSGLRTLPDAIRAVDFVDRPNVGHVIDALHLMRSGGSPEDVRNIDPRRIFLGQLCDAKQKRIPPSDDELRAEARMHREYPGEGDAPLHELLLALPKDLEIEIEVPRSDFGAMGLVERARAIGDIFRRYMAAFDDRHTVD